MNTTPYITYDKEGINSLYERVCLMIEKSENSFKIMTHLIERVPAKIEKRLFSIKVSHINESAAYLCKNFKVTFQGSNGVVSVIVLENFEVTLKKLVVHMEQFLKSGGREMALESFVVTSIQLMEPEYEKHLIAREDALEDLIHHWQSDKKDLAA